MDHPIFITIDWIINIYSGDIFATCYYLSQHESEEEEKNKNTGQIKTKAQTHLHAYEHFYLYNFFVFTPPHLIFTFV